MENENGGCSLLLLLLLLFNEKMYVNAYMYTSYGAVKRLIFDSTHTTQQFGCLLIIPKTDFLSRNSHF